MIKALLLVIDPVATWDRIVLDNRKWVGIAAGSLLPLLLFVAAVEGSGLMRWGKTRAGLSDARALSLSHALVFESGQLVLSLVVVFVSSWLVKSLGETFHGRHNYNETFAIAAYGLSPVFVLRMLNAFQGVSPWVCWGIGIALSYSLLYHGLPRVMKPDPSHAFGLFLTSAFLLTMITGLACLLTAFYLQGRFTKLDALVSRFFP